MTKLYRHIFVFTTAIFLTVQVNAQCTATVIPYVQDFQSATTPSVPACTSAENVGSGNIWQTANNPGNGFTSKALRYSYSILSPADTWFYTQGLSLTAGTSYRLTYRYGNSAGSSFPERLNVSYGASATASAMTMTLTNHFDFVNDFPLLQTVDFIPASTGVYYMGFHAYSPTDMSYIYVDDITVGITPTCFEPTTITSSNLTASSAVLSWTGGSASPSFEMYYGPSPLSTPTASTVPTATTNVASYTLTGLSANVGYSMYVRARCSATDQSAWAAVSFTTPCAAAAVPYTQNFEAVTPPALPACFRFENITGGADDSWSVSNSPGFGFLSKTLFYTPGEDTANSWIYLQSLNLTAGTSYRLSYRYACTSSTYPANLEVRYGTSALATAMTGTLTTHPNFITNYSTTKTVDFIPSANGVYYIGFHASIVNYSGILLDDISVNLSPTCLEPVVVNMTSTGATHALVNWAGGSASGPWDIYYGTSPLTIPTSSTAPTATASLTSYTLNGLAASTAYTVYVRTHCSPTDQSFWVPVSFTTSCLPVTVSPFTEGFEGVTTPALPSCWTVINANHDFAQWATENSTSDAHTGTKCVTFYTSTDDDWLITPPIVLTGSKQLKYWMKSGSTMLPSSYTVKLSTSGLSPSAFTNTLLSLTTVSNTTYVQNTINLSAYSGSTVAIAFHIPPGSLSGYALNLDDISIEDAPCVTPTVVAVSSHSAICVGQSAVLSVSNTASSYTWSANAGSATTPSVSVSPTVTTVYTVTAANGTCTATSSVSIIVDCTVGVKELNGITIQVMPNPNSGLITISIPHELAGYTVLEVYDAIGKLVIRNTLSASDNPIITSHLEKGLYLYQIYHHERLMKTGKMIRE